MKRVALLGSTGSIGINTLDVLSALSDRFQVVSLSAGRNIELLCEQAERFKPQRVCVSGDVETVRPRLKSLGINVVSGLEGLLELASDPEIDLVINGLVAGLGLQPTLAAVDANKDVVIANKETLVVAGHIILDLAVKKGVRVLPLDSELTPLWHTLQETPKEDVKRVLLPASGGPFFEFSKKQMAIVTPQQATKHPTWKMGSKISVDSATLMNKGFEVIEAGWVLQLPTSMVQVVIHRQSIVHGLIEFVDGSLVAHMSTPDMRLPIQQVLIHPERLPSLVPQLDLVGVGELTFQAPDFEKFPCLNLCLEAQKIGGTAPAVLNAANDVGVYAFLDDRIRFLDISEVVSRALEAHQNGFGSDLEEIFEADRWARKEAGDQIQKIEK